MIKYLAFVVFRHREFRKERRRLWPRALGWLASVATWGLLVFIWYVAADGGVL